MGIGTITIKADSFHGKNTVLFDGEVSTASNKTQNCARTPILMCADDFIEDACMEANGKFVLQVEGNVFECALLAAKAAKKEHIVNCNLLRNRIGWSTRERLDYLAEKLRSSAYNFTIPVKITGNVSVALPQYPMVTWADSSTSEVFISDDIYEIKDFLLSGAQCVVFYIGHDNVPEARPGQHVIRCSIEEAQSMLDGYLESKYINPIIGELARKNREKFNERSEPLFFLSDRVEPYFYTRKLQQPLNLFNSETTTLGIHALSMDTEHNIQIDDSQTLLQLKQKICYDDSSEPPAVDIIHFNPKDPRVIHTHGTGPCNIIYYLPDNTKLVDVKIFIRDHNYIHTLNSDLYKNGTRDFRWRIGEEYQIKTEFFPTNAEDRNTIKVTVDNPDIATIKGNTVTILQEGTFTLITTSAHHKEERMFNVHDAIVRNVHIRRWPQNNELVTGSTFKTSAYAEPASAMTKWVKCEVVSGHRSVMFQAEKPGEFVLSALKPGTATIKFTSLDNPEVSRTKTLIVTKTPPRRPFIGIFGWIAFGIVMVSILDIIGGCDISLDYFNNMIGYTTVALICALIAMFRRERSSKVLTILSLITAILVAIIIFGVFDNPYANNEEDTQASTHPTSTTRPSTNTTYPSTNTTTPSTSTAPKEILFKDSADYRKMITGAKALIFEEIYTDSTTSLEWKPVAVNCLGYYITQDIGASRSIYLLFDVQLVNSGAENPISIYATADLPGMYNEGKGTEVYNWYWDEIKWRPSIQDWVIYIGENALETNISDQTVSSLLGWDAYLQHSSAISSQDREELIDMAGQQLQATTQNATFHSARIVFADTVYDSLRNKILIYFEETRTYSDGLSITYYYPVYCENVKIIHNEDGTTSIDWDTVKLDTGNVVTAIPKEGKVWIPSEG